MKRYMLSAFLGSLLLLLSIAFSSTFHVAIVKTTGSIGGIILAAAALVMNALEDPPPQVIQVPELLNHWIKAPFGLLICFYFHYRTSSHV